MWGGGSAGCSAWAPGWASGAPDPAAQLPGCSGAHSAEQVVGPSARGVPAVPAGGPSCGEGRMCHVRQRTRMGGWRCARGSRWHAMPHFSLAESVLHEVVHARPGGPPKPVKPDGQTEDEPQRRDQGGHHALRLGAVTPAASASVDLVHRLRRAPAGVRPGLGREPRSIQPPSFSQLRPVSAGRQGGPALRTFWSGALRSSETMRRMSPESSAGFHAAMAAKRSTRRSGSASTRTRCPGMRRFSARMASWWLSRRATPRPSCRSSWNAVSKRAHISLGQKLMP